MQTEIWQNINAALNKYKNQELEKNLDYSKFYIYSLVTHSTAIEGSTLTELETQILFEDGLTAKNKPLIYHLMNQDLKNAYDFALKKAAERQPVTVDFLTVLNAKTMHSTGSVHDMPAGMFDSSAGEFRLCNVSAGWGGNSYINFTTIPAEVSHLCTYIQNKTAELDAGKNLSAEETAAWEYKTGVYNLSFDAHFELVTIHPWVDGNGRTARLLMNYLQFEYGLFPSKVFEEDREEYIRSLVESRRVKSHEPFRTFMAEQLLKSINGEIK